MSNGYDNIFSLFIFVLGCVLLITNFQIDNSILPNCAESSLKSANKGVLILAVCAILISFSYILCKGKMANLGHNSSSNYSHTFYLGFLLAIGIVLIALGSTISNAAKSDKDKCGDAVKHANLIIIIGALITTVTGGYFSYQIYDANKHHVSAAYQKYKPVGGGQEGTELSFPRQSSM